MNAPATDGETLEIGVCVAPPAKPNRSHTLTNRLEHTSCTKDTPGTIQTVNRAWQTFRTVILETLLPAYLIITFLVIPATVRGDSMLPGIESGDVLLVWKLERWLDAWGLRRDYLTHGDVIVLKPDHASSSSFVPFVGRWFAWKHQPYFVKRVIGLGPDKLRINNGEVVRNGSAVLELYINGPASAQDYPEVEVADRHVYVMGDNRRLGESIDSRHFGSQGLSGVAGRAVWRVWPLNRFGIVR
jgi:signal peptidase I